METNGVASYRHRCTPSSDRFLNVFSPPSSGFISGGSSVDGDELNEDDVFWTGVRRPNVSRPPPSSTARVILAIPGPPINERDYAQSMPLRKQSAPMNVPVFARRPTNNELGDVDIGDDDDEEMLPPHEIVARGSSRSPKTTHSVLEGVGSERDGGEKEEVGVRQIG